MNIKKVGVFGHVDHGKTALVEALMDKLDDPHVIILNEDNVDDYIKYHINHVEPFVIRPLPKLSMYGEGKQFTCKGKHQYRKFREHDESENVYWQCQCGRKL